MRTDHGQRSAVSHGQAAISVIERNGRDRLEACASIQQQQHFSGERFWLSIDAAVAMAIVGEDLVSGDHTSHGLCQPSANVLRMIQRGSSSNHNDIKRTVKHSRPIE
jgi:hypothetical protein